MNLLTTSLADFVLFFGMVALLEIGRRLALRQKKRDPDGAGSGVGAVDGAVFGLMGLLVAFTFSGAASRFDARRHLIIDEANAIGTAYLRLDLLPAAAQPKLRQDFVRYLDARLATYRSLPDVDAARAEHDRAVAIQGEIWSQAVAAARDLPQATMLLLPALNEMIDISSTRLSMAFIHPPSIIYFMLFFLALVCSLLAGYGMGGSRRRSWLHMFGFALIMTTTIYVIVDLEYPRFGFIRVDAADQILEDVRKGFK